MATALVKGDGAFLGNELGMFLHDRQNNLRYEFGSAPTWTLAEVLWPIVDDDLILPVDPTRCSVVRLRSEITLDANGTVVPLEARLPPLTLR